MAKTKTTKTPKKITKKARVAVKKTMAIKTSVKKTPKTVKSEPKGEVKTKQIVDQQAETFVLPVLDVTGGKSGKITLPQAIFGVTLKPELLAQAVRVYLANQRQGHASTKTRGEVEGSTRKIFRQKGTGRARHGGIRAPIFVGGGIAFGPKPIDYRLEFPRKMRKSALRMALSSQYKDEHITVVDGLADLPPKTKKIAETLDAIGVSGSTLLVVDNNATNVKLGARNLEDVEVMTVGNLHAYAFIMHTHIIFSKDTVVSLINMLKV